MNSSSFDPALGYMPSIPLPFYGRIRKQDRWKFWLHFSCSCGKAFHTEREYEVHYALTHISPLEPAK